MFKPACQLNLSRKYNGKEISAIVLHIGQKPQTLMFAGDIAFASSIKIKTFFLRRLSEKEVY
jgi:hypothetical protein